MAEYEVAQYLDPSRQRARGRGRPRVGATPGNGADGTPDADMRSEGSEKAAESVPLDLHGIRLQVHTLQRVRSASPDLQRIPSSLHVGIFF